MNKKTTNLDPVLAVVALTYVLIDPIIVKHPHLAILVQLPLHFWIAWMTGKLFAVWVVDRIS